MTDRIRDKVARCSSEATAIIFIGIKNPVDFPFDSGQGAVKRPPCPTGGITSQCLVISVLSALEEFTEIFIYRITLMLKAWMRLFLPISVSCGGVVTHLGPVVGVRAELVQAVQLREVSLSQLAALLSTGGFRRVFT